MSDFCVLHGEEIITKMFTCVGYGSGEFVLLPETVVHICVSYSDGVPIYKHI